jgi:hypothetical protein
MELAELPKPGSKLSFNGSMRQLEKKGRATWSPPKGVRSLQSLGGEAGDIRAAEADANIKEGEADLDDDEENYGDADIKEGEADLDDGSREIADPKGQNHIGTENKDYYKVKNN